MRSALTAAGRWAATIARRSARWRGLPPEIATGWGRGACTAAIGGWGVVLAPRALPQAVAATRRATQHNPDRWVIVSRTSAAAGRFPARAGSGQSAAGTSVVDSRHAPVSEMWPGEPRRRPLLQLLRAGADRRAGAASGDAKDGHGHLLRRGRVDRARRAPRPGGDARHDGPLLCRRPGAGGTAGRRRREGDRRRAGGRLRDPDGARGRRTEGGPGGRGDARGGAGDGGGAGADRRQHRRRAGPRPDGGRVAGGRRRRQRGCPTGAGGGAGRGTGRRRHLGAGRTRRPRRAAVTDQRPRQA